VSASATGDPPDLDRDAWRSYGTCLISDAAESLGFEVSVPGLLPQSVERTVVGSAVTVRLGAFSGRPSERHLCTAAIDASGAGDVLVVAGQGRTDAASWGGLLSLAASTRSVEGVVVDGACRDVDDAVDLDLPVYARAAVVRTARGRIVELDWSVPVAIGDRVVSPGDVVVADRSGVVVVPLDRVAAVDAAARELSRTEQRIADAVRSGAPISGAMGAQYENLGSAR
jgi:regulator of RNase E activity RraA